MKIADVIALHELDAGGPGSGRHPSGISHEIHNTLTRYGYKHTGGDVEHTSSKVGPMSTQPNKYVMYHHPEGHTVAVDRSKGVSDWKWTHKDGDKVPTMTRVSNGRATLVGPNAGSGQQPDRLGSLLYKVHGDHAKV
jgi:hypothetical protein